LVGCRGRGVLCVHGCYSVSGRSGPNLDQYCSEVLLYMYLVIKYNNYFYRYVISGKDRCLLHYRKVQILLGLVNRTIRRPVITCYLLGTIIDTTTALYVIITSLAILPTPLILLFANIAFDFFIVIQVIVKLLALPHLKSKKFIGEIFRQSNRRVSRWARRFLKSCPPVYISLDNWIFESRTSLIITQICIENIIALLLL
jgi:hypothetical protein